MHKIYILSIKQYAADDIALVVSLLRLFRLFAQAVMHFLLSPYKVCVCVWLSPYQVCVCGGDNTGKYFVSLSVSPSI